MKTRAKFKCEEVTHTADGIRVKLSPVMSGSEENNTFFKFTPYGSIEMGIVNPNVKFNVGREYYVDFTEVELDLHYESTS